jgi:hypothetical protein
MSALTGVIGRFMSGTYTVTRTAAGTRTLGRYTPGASSTFSIDASVQPVTGRALQALPEGHRAEETRLVLTTTEIRTRTPTNEADTISIDSESWAVVKVERWDAFGGTHYRAFVARQANV